MKPTARMLSRAQIATDGDHVTVSFDGGAPTRHLTHATYRVWVASDGQRSVDALADMLDLTSREVFEALDVLADFGLIEARQAPPTNTLASRLPVGMNRREALARIALGVAGGAAALSLGARSALAQDTTKAADTKATTAGTKAATADDAALQEEIAAIDKRLKERHAKRKKIIDCRGAHDKRTEESATKREACGNPGQLTSEINRDERALAKKRRQEKKRKTSSHQEQHYKTKAR